MPRSSGRMNRERSKGTPAVQSSGKKRPENENENLKSKYFMIFYDILEQREAIGWKKTMVCTESNRSSIRRHPTCRPQLILRPFRFFLRSRRFETFHSACCTTGPLWRVVQMLCNFQSPEKSTEFQSRRHTTFALEVCNDWPPLVAGRAPSSQNITIHEYARSLRRAPHFKEKRTNFIVVRKERDP